MSIDECVTSKREEILRLAARRGATKVRVFGSAVHGEIRPESDIDFLIDLEPERSLFDIGGLSMDLKQLLGRDVDIVTENGLHWYIREQVIREAQPL